MRTDYTIPALAIPLLIAIAANLPACYSTDKPQHQEPPQQATETGYVREFIDIVQDERGLISCSYVTNSGDTAALDYLTVKGFNNLLAGDIENVYNDPHTCTDDKNPLPPLTKLLRQ
jgi:hypothetical protein